jgi:MFS family permease
MLSYLLSITKFDRSVLLYMLAWSMIGFVHLGIYLVLTNLYIIKLGFDLSYVGILNGSGQIIWAIFALPAGMIGARFGLRNSLVAGFAIVSFGMAGFLSIAWLPQPAWTAGLLLSNAFTWIGAAVVVVNGSPYLMAITPEKDRNKAFTLQAALFTLAAFVGSLMAGMLPDFFLGRFPGVVTEAAAYNTVLWLSVPAYLVSAVLLLKVPVPSRSSLPIFRVRPRYGNRCPPPCRWRLRSIIISFARRSNPTAAYVTQIVGDAFQGAFRLATQALFAAVQAQRDLQNADWPPEIGPLMVRMGIHTGPAEPDPKGDAAYAVSHTLNRAARIMSAGHGGQILLSLESASLVERELPEGMRLVDLGQHHLKGMSYPNSSFR